MTITDKEKYTDEFACNLLQQIIQKRKKKRNIALVATLDFS
ncbi:hypothetical protein FACS189449_11150 [Alphaproteobacteria bacterium]|nr:hypothetical protein FACS189449_11150 [Alphaproteobacteria bacterium]